MAQKRDAMLWRSPTVPLSGISRPLGIDPPGTPLGFNYSFSIDPPGTPHGLTYPLSNDAF